MIRDEFKPYFDGTGLLAPHPNPGMIGSDNGPMFLSEFMIMLKQHGELSALDIAYYHEKISSCMNDDGTLNRVVRPNRASQEGPDDYLGVLNGCKQLGITDLPRRMLLAMFCYLGFLNNVNPGHKTVESFLARQPQLIAAMVAASFPLWTIKHTLIRLLFFPLFAYSALVIAISCIGVPITESDPRRLGWHLLQITKDLSLLCNLASKLWYRRLFKHYGSAGMKAVAAIYYGKESPHAKYWENG